MAYKDVREFLLSEIARFFDTAQSMLGSRRIEELVHRLSVEEMAGRTLSTQHQRALTQFRHLNKKARYNACRRAWNEYVQKETAEAVSELLNLPSTSRSALPASGVRLKRDA